MKQTVLITGASSGIGYELSKVFARNGYDLVLIARGEQRLRSVADELAKRYGVVTKTIAKDVARAESAQEIYDELARDNVGIDILVNNAGAATFGLFADADPGAEAEIIGVNIAATTNLTRLFLPAMIQRRNGKILNVASTAAFQPGPLMAVYYASKAYILSFSEAIANELQGTGVTVTALCPGPVRTEFQKRAHMENSKLNDHAIVDVSIVANMGYDGLMKGKTVVIPGFRNKVLALVVRLSPRKMVTDVVRRMQELRKPK